MHNFIHKVHQKHLNPSLWPRCSDNFSYLCHPGNLVLHSEVFRQHVTMLTHGQIWKQRCMFHLYDILI